MDDKIEIKDLTQGEPTVTDWLIYQSADDNETYKAPKSDIEGENAYVYVAYADDEDGNGFTNTFNESKDYIAVKSTNTEIPAPVASDFAGLWKNYKGAKGDDGDAATATAGTTTTLAAGQNAKVTNVGTTSAAVFKFEIPKGDKGDDGAKIVTAEFVGNDIHFNLDDGTEAILVGAKTDLKGATGNTGASVVDAEVSGDDIVFTKSDGSTITIENILIELRGEAGNGIATIEKTDTTGLVDTYTITYDDETTKTFTVTNGAKGDKGDAATIAVGTTTTGDAGTEASVENVGTSSNAIFNFTIPKGDKGTGITSIEKTGTSDLTDTYTITFSDETTTTFDVVNGEKGDNAYIYIAYASDDTGTDFTTTFNSALDYIAVLSSYVEIPSPQASDFAGLWKKYKGEKGDTGERGLNWTNEEYSGATTYNVDDALFYNGSSYRCISESTGHLPTDTTYWALIAQKGLDSDMLASVYDPTNIAGDAFDMDNMAQGTTNKFLSSAELTVVQNTSGTNTGDQDATDFDIKDLTDSTSLRTTWSGKQDALISATNIKTINGNSILGIGNLDTPDTTYTASDFDIKDLTDSTSLRADWNAKEDASNKVTSFQATPDDSHYASEKLTYDQLALKASLTGAETITNKRITPRVLAITSSATPTINTDNYDAVTITALSEAITSFTTNLSGTPTNFQKLIIRIKDSGTAQAITWGDSFQSGSATLPTTTTSGKTLMVGLIYDSVDSKWTCEATGSRA